MLTLHQSPYASWNIQGVSTAPKSLRKTWIASLREDLVSQHRDRAIVALWFLCESKLAAASLSEQIVAILMSPSVDIHVYAYGVSALVSLAAHDQAHLIRVKACIPRLFDHVVVGGGAVATAELLRHPEAAAAYALVDMRQEAVPGIVLSKEEEVAVTRALHCLECMALVSAEVVWCCRVERRVVDAVAAMTTSCHPLFREPAARLLVAISRQ
jgi:hypothetical protein